jgi:hypothetical protein
MQDIPVSGLLDRDISQPVEGGAAIVHIGGMDNQVEILVASGLLTYERIDSPSAGEPEPDAGIRESASDPKDVVRRDRPREFTPGGLHRSGPEQRPETT